MKKEEIKFFSLMSDTTFKYLFKNQKTRFFFDDLILYYTGIDISEFDLIDNEISSGNQLVSYQLDTLLVNKKKDFIINIELNRENEDYTELRNRRYLHTLAGTSKDSSYQDKRVVIQLNFNGFKSKNSRDISRETFQLHDIENDILLDDFIIYNVFIPKEINLCYNKDIKKKLELFQCTSYEEMKEVVENNKELMSIMDEIERLNKEKYFGGLYNAEEEHRKMEETARLYGIEEGKVIGIEEGKVIGIEEGKTIGLEEKSKEIAKKLLKENMSLEKISEITDLSIEELEKLSK